MECVGSGSEGGEVWTATDVKYGEYVYPAPCDASNALREGIRQYWAAYTTMQFADFLFQDVIAFFCYIQSVDHLWKGYFR